MKLKLTAEEKALELLEKGEKAGMNHEQCKQAALMAAREALDTLKMFGWCLTREKLRHYWEEIEYRIEKFNV